MQEVEEIETEVKRMKEHRETLMNKVREINKEKSKVRAMLDQADADARRHSPQPDLRRRASPDRAAPRSMILAPHDSRSHHVRGAHRHESEGAGRPKSHRDDRASDDRASRLRRQDRQDSQDWSIDTSRQDRSIDTGRGQDWPMSEHLQDRHDRPMSERLASRHDRPPHHHQRDHDARDARDAPRGGWSGTDRGGGGRGVGGHSKEDDDGDM